MARAAEEVHQSLAIKAGLKERAPVGEQRNKLLTQPFAFLVNKLPVRIHDSEVPTPLWRELRGKKLVFNALGPEVHQACMLHSGEIKIIQSLRAMCRSDRFCRFGFEHDPMVEQQIH